MKGNTILIKGVNRKIKYRVLDIILINGNTRYLCKRLNNFNAVGLIDPVNIIDVL